MVVIMNSDLYSLAKDMLVKLVSTIREDTIKEISKEISNKYEEKIEKLEEKIDFFRDFIEDESNFEYTRCSFFGCDAIRLEDNDDLDDNEYFFGCNYFKRCDGYGCPLEYCDKHKESCVAAFCERRTH